MTNPFRIEGPALVSVSGGRTSAYMLRRILDASEMASDVYVVFADTGKERPETYEFVRRISREWSVTIHWVYRPGYFDQLIADKKFLPNPTMRFCTAELKVKPMRAFMLERGFKHWLNVVGIRADEPRRASRMRGQVVPEWDNHLPLADAGIRKADVMEFWKRQPFDLQLQPWESNCDLCFLKGRAIRARIMEDKPELAAWWVEKERQVGGTFRPDSVSYAALFRQTQTQSRLFAEQPACVAPEPGDDDLGDCVCSEGSA